MTSDSFDEATRSTRGGQIETETTRGFPILVARVTARKYKRILLLCHYFARMNFTMKMNQNAWDKTNAAGLTLTRRQTPVRIEMGHNQTGIYGDMAGKKGQSGPSGNANAFRHGLATIQRRRADGELTDQEQDIRADIL